MAKESTATTTLSLRLTPDERRLIEEAAEKKGWKAANFLRVSALERAAHVLNLSRPSSFDFSGAAKRFAEVLIAPRTVTIGSPVGLGAQESLVDLREDTTLADVVEDQDLDLENLSLQDFRPRPLTPEQVEELQKAMRLGGAEFADELIVECRRLRNVANDPNLPPPIDPHNLKG